MNHTRTVVRMASVLLATTIGAGAFAIPYVVAEAGWALVAGYLLLLGLVLYAAHVLYAETLEATGEEHRLVGLVRRYGGEHFFLIACVAVLGGLLMTLFAYLLLTTHFLHILFPSFGEFTLLLSTWFLLSFPLLFGIRRFVQFEFLGTALMVSAIAAVFFGAPDLGGFLRTPAFNSLQFFFPFGPLLFALAAWTAVEPMYEYAKREGNAVSLVKRALAWGTGASIVLYALFAIGILGTVSYVTPDVISGFTSAHPSTLVLLCIFGILAVWTSYVPVAREVQKMLEDDLRMQPHFALAVPLLLPLAFAAAGAGTFFEAVSFAGGVLLSLEYLFILFVARRALSRSQFSPPAFFLLSAVFAGGALYELVRFVLQ